MVCSKPRYILFAGANGTGKSTLFRLHPEYQNLPRINTDEIVREYGDWQDLTNQIKASREAVKLLKAYFEDKISFNQETTLCGRSVLGNIKKAGNLGYHVEMHYIGVDSVDICKERIRKRIADGGHGIPDEDIERRYGESSIKMKKVLPLCDRVYFYDNSESFNSINDSQAEFLCGELKKQIAKCKQGQNKLEYGRRGTCKKIYD